MEIYFVFFFPPAKKEERNPNPQSSTFANRTSRHTTEVCKRAVFCHRTRAKLLHLSF
jgi:hypothetical protein